MIVEILVGLSGLATIGGPMIAMYYDRKKRQKKEDEAYAKGRRDATAEMKKIREEKPDTLWREAAHIVQKECAACGRACTHCESGDQDGQDNTLKGANQLRVNVPEEKVFFGFDEDAQRLASRLFKNRNEP